METKSPTHQPLKKLPYACTKAKFLEMYLDQESERTLRGMVNAVLIDNRKLDPSKPHYFQKIRHEELEKLVEEMGLPKGYTR